MTTSTNLTYNIVFQSDDSSNDKGFAISIEEAKKYINRYNGTRESYFADYGGGTVEVVCNETGETVYWEEVKLS